MTETTFYPGDTVRIGRGRVLWLVDIEVAQKLARTEGELMVALRSYNTGQPRDISRDRLTLVERGEQGASADAEAQRAAEAVAERARIERRKATAGRPAASGTRRLGAPRPAFGTPTA